MRRLWIASVMARDSEHGRERVAAIARGALRIVGRVAAIGDGAGEDRHVDVIGAVPDPDIEIGAAADLDLLAADRILDRVELDHPCPGIAGETLLDLPETALVPLDHLAESMHTASGPRVAEARPVRR